MVLIWLQRLTCDGTSLMQVVVWWVINYHTLIISVSCFVNLYGMDFS
jgi:hypothetical protein